MGKTGRVADDRDSALPDGTYDALVVDISEGEGDDPTVAVDMTIVAGPAKDEELARELERRGARVTGYVAQDELARLYAEPGLSVYQPEPVLARLEDGSSLPALCYVLPASHPPISADARYAAELRALAARLGLPPGYVGAIG